MLYSTPPVSKTLTRELGGLDELREQLSVQTGTAGHWLGSLRRQWRASSAESSIEIEGFRVPEEETIGLVSGEGRPDPGDDDRMALSCYGRAMDHVGVMASDPVFRWVDRVILDLHFDACYFQKDKDPGHYRRSGVGVTSPRGGPPAYVGPDHAEVPGLMNELITWLDRDVQGTHVVIRAAMAHLHLVSVHPFRDGNGRVSRILQSLVLAREGLLAPEMVSIEEHLGRNTDAYYATLQKVQGGSYQPERDAAPWVRFCVKAHIEQAQRRLAQIAEAAIRWSSLEEIVEQRDWPERLVIALEQSLFHGVDRSSYAAEADVSVPTASNDLRRLLDAALVVQQGRGRTTRYAAADGLRADVRRKLAERSGGR